jgi:hypothetical protein
MNSLTTLTNMLRNANEATARYNAVGNYKMVERFEKRARSLRREIATKQFDLAVIPRS